ncbi:hypothetical protein A2627_02405 [Candidatus Woesebacteria bacterium RIFCSPHIGHO2_01_FULL_39_28]|uniref:Methyltransferase type 11 domain-containing protein n=1 Tax=Candidatus Woesebacteria bacterium RIFCSPHIGHO2_01_FULL_39_28 TaxID=1802496 RepID=A0A1F7YI34_9BACT|nr:MAG: hypothetical protein A2627_02405 [Candidatus Woesebacteria bacterium RIFCSPHIGHO2_01_FULL_39_28]OGM57179.1 MAG: hypothetical protein A3A50_03265 [Candidatus Woesebacteria bacterium RIFCSPLOWO2_01_FULL_38_20]
MKKSLKKYYDKKYFEKRDYLDLHLAEAIKLLAKNQELMTILDVGCGTGLLTKFLRKSGFNAYGLDPFANLPKNKYFVKASAERLPFNNASFDLVTSISVIEHLTLRQVYGFLKEVKRILKPKGVIFLITPNFATPIRFFQGDKWFGYSDPTHITFYTPKSAALLLKSYGFTNIKFMFKTKYNTPFDWDLPDFIRRLPSPFKKFITYLLISTPISNLKNSFWISGEK